MTTVVIDSSAVVGILLGEPEGPGLAATMAGAERRLMSTGTLLELGIVLEARLGPAATGILERFLRSGDIELVPLAREQVDAGLEGWRRYGRGRHPARLNMGDCLAYGLAIAVGADLLATGSDFARTDVPLAGIHAEP